MSVWDDAVFLWHPGDGSTASKNLIGDVSASGVTEGSIVTHSGRTGRSYSGAVGSRFTSPLASSIRPNSEWTMMAVSRFPSAGALQALCLADSTDGDRWARLRPTRGGTGEIDLRGNGSSTPGANDWPLVAPADVGSSGDFVTVMSTFDTTGTNLGTLTAYQGSTTPVGTDAWNSTSLATADRLTVGRLEDSSPTDSTGGEVYAAAVWNRVLTSAEIDEVFADPFGYLTVTPRLAVGGNQAFAASVAYSTAPSGSFPAGDDRYLDGSLFNYAAASAAQLLTKGHYPQEGGNIGWNSGSPVQITLDYGEARDAAWFYVQGYFGTSSIVRPSAIKLEWSDDNSSWTTVADKTSLTAGGAPGARGWLARFTTTGLSHRYWRVTLTWSGTWLFVNAIVHGGPIASLMGVHTVSPAAHGSYPIIPVSRLFDTASDWDGTNGSHILIGQRDSVTDGFIGMVGVSNVGSTTTHTLDNVTAVAADFLYLMGYGGSDLIEEPTSIIIQYSDNGSSWTTHETRGSLGDQGQPGGHKWVAIFDIAGQVHRYWRAQLLHGGEWIHLAAFELWADMVDIAVGRDYTVSPATDGNFPQNSVAYRRTLPGSSVWSTGGGKLVDGQLAYPGAFSTGVGWNGPNPGTARLDLGSAQAGDHLVVHGIHGSGANMRTPTAVTLAYSDDDSTWTTIYTKSSLTAAGGGIGDRFVLVADISALGAHRYWRAQITHTSLFSVLSSLEFWQNQGVPPDAPVGVSATAISTTEIEVEWADVSDETGYRVERSLDGTTGWTDVSGDLAADTEFYLDDGLTDSTQYFYRIIAFNDNGDSDPSAVVDDTTFSPTPPAAPTGVAANPTSSTTIAVTWSDVLDETGYRVERSADGVSGWTDVSGSLPADTTLYEDTGLTPETEYFYRVFAFNAEGDSDPSDVVSATTPMAPPPIPPTGITKPWFEVWSRPGAEVYRKKIADLPVIDGSVTVPYSGVGKGSMRVRADFDRFDEILVVDKDAPHNSVWSTVKVMDDTGWLYEWLPTPRTPVDGSKNDVDVEFAGDGLEAIWGFARVEPWDWDGTDIFRSTFPDWIWGGRNLLNNPGFEESGETPIIDELWVIPDDPDESPPDMSGTYFLSDGTNNTDAIDWDEDNPHIIEQLLEEAGIYDDCLVSGTGTEDDPFTIEAVEPFEGVTLTVITGFLINGTADIKRIQFGSLQPSSWSKSGAVSIGTPLTFGAYDSFRVVDDQAHSGIYSLQIEPGPVETTRVRYAGAQQVVQVKPGGIYQAKVWVYPTSATDTFRFVIRGIDGDFIKSWPGGLNSQTLTPNVWNELVIEDVLVGNNSAIIFRIATTNPVGTDPSLFYIDDGEFNEGMMPTTVGCMVSQLYDDATCDHAGTVLGDEWSGRVVWLNEACPITCGPEDCPGVYLTLDFDCEFDSGGATWDRPEVKQTFRPRMTYIQVLDQIVEEGGYEWRVVPDDVEAGTYLLQLFNPGNLGFVRDAGIVGGSTDTGRDARFFAPDATHMLVEGEDNFTGRAENAGLISAFGRIEGSLLDQNWTTEDSVNSAAVEALDENLLGAEGVIYTLDSPAQRPLVRYRPGDQIRINDPPVLEEFRRVSQIQLSIAKDEPDQFSVHISDAIPFRFIGGGGVKVQRGLKGQAATDNAVAALLKAYRPSVRNPLPSLRIIGGGGQMTVTVAASNATDQSKGKADLQCEGVNDDMVIQQAFDMLGGRGGKVVLSEGRFHFGTGGVITPPVPFHLHGMGQGATEIYADEVAPFFFLNGTATGEEEHQMISDMAFLGQNKIVNAITVISLAGTQNAMRLENLVISSCSGSGVSLPRPAGSWQFRRCLFSENGGQGVYGREAGMDFEDCIFYANGGGGIQMEQDGDGKILGCLFWLNTGNGVGSGNAISQGFSRYIIANNLFIANTAYGIRIQDGDSNQISDNIFAGNGTASIGFGAGAFGVAVDAFVTGNNQEGSGTFVAISAGSSAFVCNNVVNAVLEEGDCGGGGGTGTVVSFADDVGDGTSTTITVNHALGSRDVQVTLYRNSSPWDEVACDVEHTDANNVDLTFVSAPSTDEYRVVVMA